MSQGTRYKERVYVYLSYEEMAVVRRHMVRLNCSGMSAFLRQLIDEYDRKYELQQAKNRLEARLVQTGSDDQTDGRSYLEKLDDAMNGADLATDDEDKLE